MNALLSSLSIAFFVCVLFHLYNQYRVDRMRQELFALRDALFDRAARGELSFDSPAYMATRTMLNGMIRFAHKASVTRVLLTVWFGSEVLNRMVRAEISGAYNASSEFDREICFAAIYEANKVCAKHFATSVLGMVIVAPFILNGMIRRGTNVLQEIVEGRKAVFERLDRVAYVEGRPCTG